LISSFPFAIIFFNDQVLAAIVCCCLLATCCSGEEVEAIATKAADKVEAIATTKLTPSIEDDPKSKTEKRDSSVQTGETRIVIIFQGRGPFANTKNSFLPYNSVI